ncbi:EexN family lipoprotein [Bartonella sp. B30(2025)]
MALKKTTTFATREHALIEPITNVMGTIKESGKIMNKITGVILLLCTGILAAGCEKNYSVSDFKKDEKLREEWIVRCGWTGTLKNCENARTADYQLAMERQKEVQERIRKEEEEWRRTEEKERAEREAEREKVRIQIEEETKAAEARAKKNLQKLIKETEKR